MKNLCISLVLIGALALSSQGVFAACNCMQNLNPMPYIGYLNPVTYVNEAENNYSFSLNPFKGFKNCNKCKMKKVKKCDECAPVQMNKCPTCKKAFAESTCNTCDEIYIAPVQPRCTSCGH